jgi:hypothetical protein
MLSVEELEQYSYMFNMVNDKKKRSNMKVHITKQLKEGKLGDSQLLLFDMLIQKEKEVKQLKETQSNIVDDDKYKKVIISIKKSIEKRDRTNLTDYETMFEVLQNDIKSKDDLCEEFDKVLGEYEECIGHKVNNFQRATTAAVPDTRVIYSRASYNELIRLTKIAISKETEGATKMRLNTYLKEYETMKELKKYR